jgi:hypothetical protein
MLLVQRASQGDGQGRERARVNTICPWPIDQDQPLPQKFEVVSVKPTPKERLNRPEDLECKNNRLVTGGFPVSFLIG